MAHGPYHRTGVAGGPGCAVSSLPVQITGPDGSPIPAHLLDAGPQATEVELLRTIVQGMGIRWGHDGSGWWAVVPNAAE